MSTLSEIILFEHSRKVNFNQEHAMKAERGSGDVALLFL
jgi:hypothetical protein